jgi:bifunctional lysine-specific demethylase and histidyl-hydroxylase NO66
MGIDPANRDEMAATATKLVAQLADSLRDHGAELAEGVAHRLARRHAERTRPVAVRPLSMLAAAGRADTVEVRWRHGLIGTLDLCEGRAVLRLPDRTLSFPGQCADAIVAIQRGEAVRANTLPGLDAADGEVVIRRLLREAVVVPTTP